MAAKRPLVIDGGNVGELSSGDTLAPAALGTGTPGAGKALTGDGAWTTLQVITVSGTAPASPAVNDLWLDIS